MRADMTLAIEFHANAFAGALSSADWQDERFDFWAFDRYADELFARREPLHVVAAPDEVPVMRKQLSIRTQRLAAHRNEHTSVPWFTELLVEHRKLHDVAKPLVRADLDHALDAWQWTLRLDADAPAAVQIAALLHDVERLISEPDARIEHLAADYQSFKNAHAALGAALSRAVLERAGVPCLIAEEACALIAEHEHTGTSADISAINDADALSFFSLNSPGYVRYFGAEQTEKKVAYTYARMTSSAKQWLGELRMPALIRDQVQRCES
jgi:hypothetical protein